MRERQLEEGGREENRGREGGKKGGEERVRRTMLL